MLQKILGAHPEIHTVSEPWIALHPLFALRKEGFAADFDPAVAQVAVTEFLRKLPEGEEAYCEGLRRMLSHLYGRALEKSGKSIFLDKTPRYYFIIPEIRRVFPRARLVFLLRNPVAVLASVLETWCKKNPAVELSHSRHDLMTAPQLIISGIRQAGASAIVVRYEELVTAPEPAVRQLCDELGIVFHPGMLEYAAAAAGSERWLYGDQGTVYQEQSPVAGRAERWRDVLKEAPVWAALARGYITGLGPDIVRELGYNYEELCAELPALPESNAWPAVMQPPNETALEQARQDVLSRTATLEKVSGLLEERTVALDQSAQDLDSRTAELVETRRLLAERTATLDQSAQDLESRTAELVETRRLLQERTTALDQSAQDLESRTAELVATRRLLQERTTALDRSAQDLQSRTAELVETRRVLHERNSPGRTQEQVSQEWGAVKE